MHRIGVVGAAGRMGRTTCTAVQEAEDMELVCAVDPAAAGADLSELLDGPSPALGVADSVDALSTAKTTVVVDFTIAAGIGERLEWYAAHGVHAVVGTSGIPPAVIEMARELFEHSDANAVIAPNFALGAALLTRFCELAAPVMDGVEIVELHHDGKVDAPSGTALHTAEQIALARQASAAGPFNEDPTTEFSLDDARGGLGPAGIRIHAVRLPGLVAHEEVIFGAAGQTLTIRHDSFDRRSFMPGVLLAIRKVGERPGLTVGLGPLLEP
ncbi:MAG: 4-hydroxy-tetrahydrodipicolinate reductase [Acidimicrobiales bacterium]